MVDQCSNCFYGQTFQIPVDVPVRVCRAPIPNAVDMASGSSTSLWKPVLDTDWCGEGADNATKRGYSQAVVLASPLIKQPARQYIPALIGLNGDASLAIPAGYAMRELFIMETLGVGLTLSVGTAAGGSDVLAPTAIAGNSTNIFTPLERWLDPILSVTIFFHSAAWGGANVNIAVSLDQANMSL